MSLKIKFARDMMGTNYFLNFSVEGNWQEITVITSGIESQYSGAIHFKLDDEKSIELLKFLMNEFMKTEKEQKSNIKTIEAQK